MNKRTKLAERKLPNYTRGEEIFNMVTHIVGAAFGVVMLVLGIVFAAVRGHVAGVLTAIVFGLSLIVLYTMSAEEYMPLFGVSEIVNVEKSPYLSFTVTVLPTLFSSSALNITL